MTIAAYNRYETFAVQSAKPFTIDHLSGNLTACSVADDTRYAIRQKFYSGNRCAAMLQFSREHPVIHRIIYGTIRFDYIHRGIDPILNFRRIMTEEYGMMQI